MAPKVKRKSVKARGKKKVARKRAATADSVAATAVVMESFALLKEVDRDVSVAQHHLRTATEVLNVGGSRNAPTASLNLGAAVQAVRTGIYRIEELANPGGEGKLPGKDSERLRLEDLHRSVADAREHVERAAEGMRLAPALPDVTKALPEILLHVGAANDALRTAKGTVTLLRGLDQEESFVHSGTWLPPPEKKVEIDAAGKIVSGNPTAPLPPTQ